MRGQSLLPFSRSLRFLLQDKAVPGYHNEGILSKPPMSICPTTYINYWVAAGVYGESQTFVTYFITCNAS
ncbi:hypothetical protein GCK32_020809 [Trichostrongylus colubriformis]|uniref:Uncharacterized protein n=1 Tax=Trichostrongylus colubriformis TaxID=6319 RepID=A0AAN8GE69_TRICO